MKSRAPRNTHRTSEIDATNPHTIDASDAVVVGVDGSSTAIRAAVWAAPEAIARQLPLRLVHFVPPIDKPAFRPGGIRYRQAHDMLETARRAAQRQLSDPARLEVQTVIAPGHADRRLLAMSNSAALIVVGTKEAGFLTRVVLGSTALALARHAHCPVTILRRPGLSTGPVLVPVTNWPAARPILVAGLRAATLRGTDLLVARIWQGRPWSHPASGVTTTAGVTDAQIAHCVRAYPGIDIRSVTVTGNAAGAIESFSGAAQLAVVGNNGEGGGLDPLADELVRHVDCPVLVVPAGRAAVSTEFPARAASHSG